MSHVTAPLSFSEVLSLVKANGREVTYMIEGEKGIGKTAIARTLAKQLGYDCAYLDMANQSLGDLTMPVVNREMRATEYYPNSQLGIHTGRPTVLMLDEFTKASREAQNMTLTLAEEKRLGDVRLHTDSIVLASGNLAVEGLGDRIQSHQAERFVQIEMAKPNAEQWCAWACDNSVDPVIIAFTDQNPHILQSYRDDPDGQNPYIFNPKKQQRRTVSPRSLEKASKQLKHRDEFSFNSLLAAMAGSIGAPAAADLAAFITMDAALTPFADIIAKPKSAPIPESPASRVLLVYTLLMRSDAENLPLLLQYVGRFEQRELVALFVNRLLSTPSKNAMAVKSPALVKMAGDYANVF